MSVNNIGCLVTENWTVNPCSKTMHGIYNLYIIPDSYLDENDFYFDTDDRITYINTSVFNWKQIDLVAQTGTFDWIEKQDPKTGAWHWEHILKFQLPHNSAQSRKYFLQIHSGIHKVAVQDNNGKYFLFGKIRGMRCVGDGTAGKAFLDFGGINITMSGYEDFPPYEIYGGNVTSTASITYTGGPGGVPINGDIHN